MTHRVFLVADEEKSDLVKHLASGRGRRILFTRTKHQAKKLAKVLTAAGIPSVDLHGNLSQAARAAQPRSVRRRALEGRRPRPRRDRRRRARRARGRGRTRRARGPPMEHKAYLHRSGRTARAGAAGTVVTVTIPSQRRDVNDLLRKAGITAPLEQVGAESAPIVELVGESAPSTSRPPPCRPSPSGPPSPARARLVAPVSPAARRSAASAQARVAVAATPAVRAVAATPPVRAVRHPQVVARAPVRRRAPAGRHPEPARPALSTRPEPASPRRTTSLRARRDRPARVARSTAAPAAELRHPREKGPRRSPRAFSVSAQARTGLE